MLQQNILINILKKEEKLETGEKYPWLDKMNERKYMTDGEILEKYINLDNTCLTEEEKKEIMDMLYKYISKCEVLPVLDLKDAFHSLRFSEN